MYTDFNMKVEIYDQYSNIYSDNQTNELVTLNIQHHRGETLDTSRYTLVHPAVGVTTVEATDLTTQEAIQAVESLYNVAKVSGTSYEDKLVKLDKGYAELVINFSDGKRLNRVIYIKE
jgi:hypothetical protein